MRVAVLVCLLAALASASSVKSFQKGQTYNYKFRTQVSSSLLAEQPALIQQQAATGMQANLKLTFTGDHTARVQLQHIRMGEMNGQTQEGQQQMIPNDLFQKRQISGELKQILELPFTVQLVDGVVQRMNFDQQEETSWSKNIKRAAINMLQLNLKRNDVQGLMKQSSIPQDEQEQRQLAVFTIPEETLEGQCQVSYTIQKRNSRYGEEQEEESLEQQQQQQQNSQFNVTKAVDFNKCMKTADVHYGIQVNADQQLRCLKCLREAETKSRSVGKTEKQEQLKLAQCQVQCQTNQLNHNKDIERSTVQQFELFGNQQKYQIRRSRVVSQYVIKAQNPEAHNTVSQVVAISELVLQEQEDGNQVPSIKQAGKDESLMYTPEWDLSEKRFYQYGDEEFTNEKRAPFGRVQRKVERAGEHVKEIMKQWNEDKEMGYELNTAILFNKLVQLVRQSTTQELKQMEQRMNGASTRGEESQNKHAKTIFLDALAVAATRNSLRMLAEKITEREINSLKAAQLIKIFIANQHSPSDRQTDILEKIATSEPAHKCPVLKQAAWLAVGASIGKICQKQPGQSQREQFRVEELCPEAKREQYQKKLVLQWKQAQSTYEQILALKVIGNSALEQVLPELQKIVVDKRQPTLIRMEAIDALRRLRTAQPERIQQTLLPVFQDQREEPAVRMAAVSMLLYTQPKPVILDQIVFTVLKDRSQNVKSFVLTAVESLAKSPASADKHIAHHLKSALQIMKISPEELRASRKYQVPIYVSQEDEVEEQNIFLGLASIVSPANMLPIHLSTSLKSAFNGDSTQEKLQLSFSQKDLEQLYQKLSSVYNRFQNEDYEENEEGQSAKDLNQIYNALGIKSRRTGSYYLSEESDEESSELTKRSSKMGNNSPFGMIVIRSNDVDQVIVPIQEHGLPEMIRNFINNKNSVFEWGSYHKELHDEYALGKHFSQHLALTVGETKIKLPTTAGLPLAVMWHTSVVASVQGKIQAELGSADQKSNVELRLRQSGIATHMHKTEVWSPVIVSGVQTHRTAELNHDEIVMRVDVRRDEIKLTIEAPKHQQNERVLGLHTLPATFIQPFNWETRSYGEARLRTIRNYGLEYQQREFHPHEQRDQPIQVEGNIHKVQTMSQLISAMYTTENNVHIYFKPGPNAPTHLTARINGFSFRRSEQQGEHKPDFKDFYPSSSQRKPFRSLYEDQEDREDGEDYSQYGFQNNEHRESRLNSYVDNYQSNKVFKHQLKINLEARTPSKTHKAELQLQGQCDHRMQHCKAIVNAQRTPIGDERENWLIQGKLQTVMPENIRNEENPEDKHSRMLIKAEAEWGTDKDQKDQRVQVRIQGEPTKKNFWRRSESTQQTDSWSRFLNKFDLVVDYKLNPSGRHLVQRLFDLVRYRYFWQLSSQQRMSHEDTVRATLIIDPITRRYANLTVQTPHERVQGKMIELPRRMQSFALERRQSNYQSFGQLVQSYTQGGSECKADDRRVRTFDGVAYRAPISECWTVLAKDCSKSPRFVVMMKKDSEQQNKLKIITRYGKNLQIEKSNGKLIVKIDGKQERNEERLMEQGVEMSGYEVFVQQRGLEVRFDGQEAKIQLNGMFKNIQCGLCGHHTGEQQDVFRTSDNKRTNNLKQFHRSFVLKNEECADKDLDKFYQGQDSNEFQQLRQRRPQSNYQRNTYDREQDSSEERDNQWWSSSEEENRENQKNKPIDRTHVLEYSQKICFSSQPVKKCPEGYTPDESVDTKEVKIQFFCLNRNSSAARRFQRQARKGEVVEAEGQQMSFYDTVQQPVKCQQAEFY